MSDKQTEWRAEPMPGYEPSDGQNWQVNRGPDQFRLTFLDKPTALRIAAVNEMDAALQEAEDKLHVFGCNFDAGADQDAAFAARDQARAALKKARGQ